MSATGASTYICRYCRLPSDVSAASCPNCGAPVDVHAVVSDSGWVEQPAIKDMARVQFGQSRCQIEGTLVPIADFGLAPGEGIYFPHHNFLWAEPGTGLEAWSKGSFFNRMYAGMPMVLVRASGPGHVALSGDRPGEVIALPVPPGRGFLVREHSFLAAGDSVDFRWQQAPVWVSVSKGDETEYEYPIGPNLDVFVAGSGQPGLLLLHSPGNLFVRDLAPGQSILVQPGSLVYTDTTVNYGLHVEYPASHGLSWRSYSYRSLWLRLTGPGRVAVRSIFERPERYSNIVASSGITQQRW